MNLSNELLLISLTEFYENKLYIQKFLNVVNGKSYVSLRLIDWYITNYCKNNNEFFYSTKLKSVDNHGFINVYASYRSQLKAYKKIKFDPFRRRERILFYYHNKSNYICTTIGQLNFFRWAIEYSILEHIENNVMRLERLMINSQKRQYMKLKENNYNVKEDFSNTKNNDDNIGKKILDINYDKINNAMNKSNKNIFKKKSIMVSFN